jgi:PAS domain S-box-containing protein
MLTLRHKLLIATVAVQVVVLLLLLAAGFRTTHDVLVAEVRSSALMMQQLLSAAVGPQVAAKDYGAVRDTVRDTAASAGLTYLVLIGADGRELASSGTPPAESGVRHVDPRVGTPEEVAGVFHMATPLIFEQTEYGRLLFGVPAARLHQAERDVLVQTAAISAAGLAISVGLLLILSGVLTRGLTELAGATELLGAGHYDVELPVRGGDEVARLSAAFNRMSSALAERVAALRDSEARQRSLVDGLAAGVLFLDAEHRVRDCNEAACRILGIPRERLLGSNGLQPTTRQVLPDGSPADPDSYPSNVALRTGTAQRDVLRGLMRGDGTRVWISINSEPLRRPGAERPYATVTSFTDVTLLIEAEQRLTQMNAELERRVIERTADLISARDAAERANRAKSEFLSRMSHELRTPLNAILGFAQILQLRPGHELAADAREQMRAIETAGWHLLQLINEVLDLSRIESGAMTVAREAVDLAAVAAECVAMAEPLAQRQRVRIVNHATEPHPVLGDATRLKQVLMNLLSNAIKYNHADGSVSLALRRLTAGRDRGRVELAVTDTGRGFSDEQLRSLYQPFNRLGAEGDAIEGTGIGLVVTKRLVELMGGSLELQTRLGAGSVFTLLLPAAEAAAVAAAPGAGAGVVAVANGEPGPRKVLYIEDNPSNVEVLASVLALRPGLTLLTAPDGPSGFALAREQHPDLIIVDIGLPGPDGFEVCRWLRADPVLSKRPVIALSANAMAQDIERGRRAGFDLYLTKPIDVPVFLAEADRLLDTSGGNA